MPPRPVWILTWTRRIKPSCHILWSLKCLAMKFRRRFPIQDIGIMGSDICIVESQPIYFRAKLRAPHDIASKFSEWQESECLHNIYWLWFKQFWRCGLGILLDSAAILGVNCFIILDCKCSIFQHGPLFAGSVAMPREADHEPWVNSITLKGKAHINISFSVSFQLDKIIFILWFYEPALNGKCLLVKKMLQLHIFQAFLRTAVLITAFLLYRH